MESAIMPAISVQDAVSRRDAMVEYTRTMLAEGTDYAVVPGTTKPVLLKPGAEKLAVLFGFSASYENLVTVEDFTGEHHNGEPFFYYRYRCVLTRDGEPKGEGIGSCNSREKKYRWRTQDRTCPKCGKPTIKRSKYSGSGEPGWYCFGKIGGCGAQFAYNDPQIISQTVGQIPNPDIFDEVNTIDKMAQKRAFVAAILIATSASEFFTQDIGDRAEEDISMKEELRELAVQANAVLKTLTGEENRSKAAVLSALGVAAGKVYKNPNATADEIKTAADDLRAAIEKYKTV